jgi:hypothetical protein
MLRFGIILREDHGRITSLVHCSNPCHEHDALLALVPACNGISDVLSRFLNDPRILELLLLERHRHAQRPACA